MRAGLSTILQTLTPEAATVLNHSIAEAGRRNHNQTTPLHVAATLLSAPTGFLRQACIRSHPNSSHPLQCRALELCFSVALERLPSATTSPTVTEPPVSNALMAALKRAQAHQRRGCPEQQQQPLLAVKVELEQLIISILDDPSVSRVMREASFSSPAVKATIEQTLNNNNNVSGGNHLSHSSLGIGFRPSLSPATPVPIPINRNLYFNPRLQRNDETTVSSSSPTNLYLNPRLQQQHGYSSFIQSGHQRIDDAKKVIEIMSKSKKNNPILVGEIDPESIKKETLMKIQNGELSAERGFENADVISIDFPPDKSQIPAKIKELSDLIETKFKSSNDGGRINRSIIIDVGDLKWLVDPPSMAVASDIGRGSVAEMANLVAKFRAENSNLWLIGTATCETYLRCQVYHPSMENDWDLQALPISSKSPLSGRIGTNGIFGTSFESLNTFKNFQTTKLRNSESARMPPCCPICYHDYEQELAELNEKSPSETKSNLPPWLQNAKKNGETETEIETKMPHQSRVNEKELQNKWSNICSRIHPNHNQNPSFPRIATGLLPVVPVLTAYKPNGLLGQSQTGEKPEAPRSPVRTDLILGPKEIPKDLPIKDLLGCISSEFQKGKFANSGEADSFKKLLKGLMQKAWWQPEAASTIATTVARCDSRGGVWLLFAGPDRVGKKKMASVLAEHVCGSDPITVCLGSRHDEDDMDLGFRGKTVLDRVVDAVRRNPSSVIVLSDVDEADMVVRGSIKRAMERSRLIDSHGREISLGNIIFVLTGNWSSSSVDDYLLDEKRLRMTTNGEWQLKLTVCEKRSKRRADWLPDGNTCVKQPKKTGSGLSLDLNLAMDTDEDWTDASDLTIEPGDDNQHLVVASVSVPHELVGPSDSVAVFKPVQFGHIRREIEKTIKSAFSTIFDEKLSIDVDEVTLDNILSGLWFGRIGLQQWAEKVLIQSLHGLVGQLPSSSEDLVARLESYKDMDQVKHQQDWLPSKINVIVDTI